MLSCFVALVTDLRGAGGNTGASPVLLFFNSLFVVVASSSCSSSTAFLFLLLVGAAADLEILPKAAMPFWKVGLEVKVSIILCFLRMEGMMGDCTC